MQLQDVIFMKNPKISVVTAVYNGAKYIEENILSVKNQSYPSIEHIIIDGGSKDGTVEIIKKYEGSYNLKWVSEKDGGFYFALNKGFALAAGDIYTWLDGDNYFFLDTLKKVADIFEGNNEIDIVHGDIEIVENNGKHGGTYRAPDVSFRKALLKNTGAIPLQPASFFKKELYKKTSDFNTDYQIAADYEFWLRGLRSNPRIFCLHTVFGSYRRGNDAVSQSFKGVLRGYREMSAIGEAYGAPLYAKIFLLLKYCAGLASASVKRVFK